MYPSGRIPGNCDPSEIRGSETPLSDCTSASARLHIQSLPTRSDLHLLTSSCSLTSLLSLSCLYLPIYLVWLQPKVPQFLCLSMGALVTLGDGETMICCEVPSHTLQDI